MRTLSRFMFAATLCCAGPVLAEHRIVVLDFDGPQTLATASRDAVVRELGRDNDLVTPKKWTDAKADASRAKRGPQAWAKAAKKVGVDAVIEGWVQDEGRSKVLTVVVTDASDGKELDQLTIKLDATGAFTEVKQRELRKGLDERLTSIAALDKIEIETPDPKPKQKIGGEAPAAPMIGPQPPPVAPEAPAPAPKQVAALDPIAPPDGRVDWIPQPVKRESRETPKVQVSAGVGWRSRSLSFGAEFLENVTQYSGVSDKFVSVNAAFYPFPWRKRDGAVSGIGFSIGVDQSIGSTVTFDDLESVGDYSIDQHGWNAAVHYRAPLNQYFSIDGEVGYGRQSYLINDAPMTFEVPNTAYHYLHAGAHLDLSVTDRASVGFGGKYFHVLDSGDLTSVDWYGPGRASGLGLDAHFVVPLPARMFVRGELAYTRFKTSFDGVGVITEEEGVYEAIDSNVSGSVKLGIQF